eukprot:2183616-Alexandrium_andersonii.AAC.1
MDNKPDFLWTTMLKQPQPRQDAQGCTTQGIHCRRLTNYLGNHPKDQVLMLTTVTSRNISCTLHGAKCPGSSLWLWPLGAPECQLGPWKVHASAR